MRRILAGLLLLLATSAQAQIVGTLPFNFTNGTTADATQVMANYNFIANQTNANAATAGANSNITALLGLTNPIGQGAGGSSVYMAGTTAGSANAQVISSGVVPSGFNLVNRPHVVFTAGITNTGAATLAINGTAATAIVKSTSNGPKPLEGGEIVIGNLVEVVYDGTNYNLITPYVGIEGAQSTLTVAATTDLGTAPTHNILLSGAGTITSFGSTATVEFPLYYLVVGTNGVVLTAGANIVLPGGANLTYNAGDELILRYNGAGVWKVAYTSAPIANLTQQPVFGNTGAVVAPAAGTTRLYATQGDNQQPAWMSPAGIENPMSSAFVSNTTVSNVTSFFIPFPADAREVEVYFAGVTSAGAGANNFLVMQFHQGAGFITSANQLTSFIQGNGASATSVNSGTATSITLSLNHGTAAIAQGVGSITVYRPNQSGIPHAIEARSFTSSSLATGLVIAAGSFSANTNPVDGMQIFLASGATFSGSFSVYKRL